eukprot:tig00000241_g21024.t1
MMADAAKEPEAPAASSSTQGETALSSPWTIWFDRKLSKEQSANYVANLQRLGTFASAEEFWRYYAHLQPPSALEVNSNFHVFREHLMPAWEAFPSGGCWIYSLKKKPDQKSELLDRLWEELLLATIGEQFEDCDEVCGIVLSIRTKEDKICVWNRDNQSAPDAYLRIGNALKDVLKLGPNAKMEYKEHAKSLLDGSTYRGARPWIVVASDVNAK